jgi:hypothetical protein
MIGVAMKKAFVCSALLCGAADLLLLAAPALAAHADGSLPIYPNAVPAGFSYSDPQIPKALKMGFAMFADTTDSTDKVDRWYKSNLPKSCTRHAESAGIHYQCSTGVVNVVVYKGKTRIAIVPSS